MPTVHREGPFRFFFFSNEGDESPHIHVQRDQALAKFWLDRVVLAASGGFRAHELRRIEQIVRDRQDQFLEAWHEFFGA